MVDVESVKLLNHYMVCIHKSMEQIEVNTGLTVICSTRENNNRIRQVIFFEDLANISILHWFFSTSYTGLYISPLYFQLLII